MVFEEISLGSDDGQMGKSGVVSLNKDEGQDMLDKSETIQRFVRSNTFSRSLRYAKARVTKLSKRMARSADDLSKLSSDPRNVSQTQIQDLTIPPRMREVSFSHQPKKEEFDYNAALEIDFSRLTKQEEQEKQLAANNKCEKSRAKRSEKENGRSNFTEISFLKWSVANSNSTKDQEKPKRKKKVRGEQKAAKTTPRQIKSMLKKKREFERQPSGSIALTPLKSEQYVRRTRRTLMLDGQIEKCECTITDNDDGEIQFSCVLSQEGIVCRNYRSMLDIVSIGSIQHLTDDDPIGIYYTIEGFKDGQIARIRKGNTFSRVKYQLNLVTPEDRKMVLSLPNNSHSPNSPLPVLKQSLVVHREWGNILKIRTKSSNFPIATIQKEMNSMRYWLHLEPNVDCCFVSAVAAYVLRKKIFGDRLPKVLKTQNGFTRRARRLSISFRRRKKPRPLRENLGNTAATSSTL